MTATILHSEAGIAADPAELLAVLFSHGGFTYNMRWNLPVADGYAVAVHRDCEVTIPLDDIEAWDIEDYILTYSQRLHQPHACLGAWLHNGLVYLDISHVYGSVGQATEIGRTHRQLAVYDLNRGCDILINYDR